MTAHFQLTANNPYYFVTIARYRWLALIKKLKLYDYFHLWIKELNKRRIFEIHQFWEVMQISEFPTAHSEVIIKIIINNKHERNISLSIRRI